MGNNRVTGLGSDIKEEEGKEQKQMTHTWMPECIVAIATSAASRIFLKLHIAT
jgi:hypothetical protein